MKTRKQIIAAFLAFVLCFTLVGCGAAPLKDNGVTNTDTYENYDFWEKENELRLFLDIKMEKVEGISQEDEVSKLDNFELSNRNQKKIAKIKEGMISYFLENYGIDISEKLDKQQIKFFTSTGSMEETMGYVDLENSDVLNLNERLFKDISYFFESAYIHETLHQIGFRNEESTLINEGITDALTDMVCCYIGIEPVLTPYYCETRSLAYMLLAADPELVSCYLEGNGTFSIEDRINEKLEGVSKTGRQVISIGERLENLETALHNIATGITLPPTDPYYLALEAQEIVIAYCKECNPSTETIDYIRSHYLVLGYEDVSITKDASGIYIVE